jgi:hypothetical protein
MKKIILKVVVHGSVYRSYMYFSQRLDDGHKSLLLLQQILIIVEIIKTRIFIRNMVSTKYISDYVRSN